MSDDFEHEVDAESDLFEYGEMIVLTLKDGRHYLGAFSGFYDTGVAVKIEAKTAFRVEKVSDSKFENFIRSRVQEELATLFSTTDWFQKALELNPNEKQVSMLMLTPEQIKEMVTSQIQSRHRKWAMEHWTGPRQDQDVTKPYLKEMKRSVRTLVMWDKIDEVCSAVEMAEEAEIADLSNLIENGEFFNLINNLSEGDTNE